MTKVSEYSRKWLRERGRVISRVCVREKTPRERVCEHVSETTDGYTPCARMCVRESRRVCEEGPMESEITHKRLMYTLIKNINCIQILGWDHDICNMRKEQSLIHQTSIFYRILACLCYYST